MPAINKKKATRTQFIFFIAKNLFTFTKANVIKSL